MVKGYGVLFEESSVKELSEILKRLGDDRQYYDCVAKQCIERAHSFDMNTMAEFYVEVYYSLLNNK